MKGKSTLLYDLILIASLIALSVILLLLTSNRDNGNSVTVEINNIKVASFSLNKNAEYSLNGGTNTLVIEDGCAFLKDSDCPDKTCEKQGKIRYQGQSIVCLPNRLQVTVEQESGGLDLVI